jgi:lipid A ethanolaminephosphotransferase
MAVKLFRETGRAGLLDASEARRAAHSGVNPLWIALALSVWLATVGNAALWQAWWNLPDMAGWRAQLPALALALMIFCGTLAVLSTLAWRGLMKWAAALVLLLCAFTTYAMLFMGDAPRTPLAANMPGAVVQDARGFANLRLLLTVLIVAMLPMLVIYRLRMRRVRTGQQIVRIAMVWAGAALVIFICLGLAGTPLSATLQKHPQLAPLVSPANWIFTLGAQA